MKSYKDFEKKYIGTSDISTLILAGYVEMEGFDLKQLHFGQDDSYTAYIVEGTGVEIGVHYEQVAEFDSWLKIYDDTGLTCSFEADKIIVYRAGEMGCIIKLEERADDAKMSGKYLYDIFLDKLGQGYLVGNQGDYIFDTADEAREDAMDYILNGLSQEYNSNPDEFRISVYEAFIA